MLYWLFSWMANRHWVSAEGLFNEVMFRAAGAILLSFLSVLLAGPRVIRMLIRMKVGDRPEFHNATLNELTRHKANTPTMGGVLIVGSILLSCILMADIGNFYLFMALLCMVYLAVLGAFDDWLKLTAARRASRSRDGLLAWEKLIFQIALGVLLAIFIYYHGNERGMADAHLLNWPVLKELTLPVSLFCLLAVLVITGTSNSVNLTDGMDGLAAGCMAITSFTFMALAYVTGDFRWAQRLNFVWIREAGELAVVCGAITGACLGFLWYNCNPAQVFMGDTGSLALGGMMGYVAIVIRQEPMLLLIGAIFVMEALSVIMQVSYFRFTGGKRIFLCSPIHHHFHMKGWSEQQVVVRFWLICALCAAFALVSVKLR